MNNTTPFLPNKGKYLVLPTAIEALTTKIEGSEYTIESQKSIHEKPAEGTVVAKGKECTEYEKGARVLFGKYSGYEQLFDGVNYLILAETEILGERLVTPFDGEPCDGLHAMPPCSDAQCWHRVPAQAAPLECDFCPNLATTTTHTCRLHSVA